MGKKFLTAAMLAFFTILTFMGCSSDDTATSSPSIGGGSSSFSIIIIGDAEVKVGESTVLTANYTPQKDNATYTWKVSDETKATLASNGNTATVTGVAAGDVTVYVTVFGITVNHTLTVKEPEKPQAGLTLNTNSIQTAKDDSFTLTAAITNASSLSDTTILWTTSDASVAALSATTGNNVTVSTKKDGAATITAKVGTLQATCAVTVKTSETVGGSVLWRADAYDAVNAAWTSPETLGIMTVMAATGSIVNENNVTVQSKATLVAKSATVDDYSFTKAFLTGGAGNETYNSLKFSLAAPAIITAYAAANGDSGERKLMLKVGAADAVSLGTTTPTAAKYMYTYSGSETVDCYLWSSASGINIYAVNIQYTGSGQTITYVYPTSVSLGNTTLALDLSSSDTAKSQLVATIANASAVSSGLDSLTWTSSDAGVATVNSTGLVTAKSAGSATITVSTVNGRTATCTVTVTGTVVPKTGLSLDDSVPGYAGLGTSYNTTATPVIVKTRAELLAALQKAGVIVIDGMIDMSDGMIPTTAGGTTEKLDALVASTTSKEYTSYTAFRNAYAASCTSATQGNSPLDSTLSKLNKAYGSVISVSLRSNTTLIGKGENCGIKGGAISINGVSNVQVRNLILQDAYDPFPHHEKNDGFNAQHDNICISGTSENIWIDHCTLEDTMGLVYVTISGGSEKWQTYDGLLDMKDNCTNITISNCKFYNHDKTMLIGSSDSNGDNTKRFITLYQNYFLNCGQRLPMVRNTTIHILNNYYDASNATYSNSYAIGVRKNAIIYAENNYFGSGISYGIKDDYGTLYSSGNTDNSQYPRTTKIAGSTLFSSAVNAYSYTALSAAEAKSTAEKSAGANQKFNL